MSGQDEEEYNQIITPLYHIWMNVVEEGKWNSSLLTPLQDVIHVQGCNYGLYSLAVGMKQPSS